MEPLSCGEELGLEKKRLQGHFIVALQDLKGANRKDGDRHFSIACSNRTRGNGIKVKESEFTLHVRKGVFYDEGCETVAQVAQRGGRCLIP